MRKLRWLYLCLGLFLLSGCNTSSPRSPAPRPDERVAPVVPAACTDGGKFWSDDALTAIDERLRVVFAGESEIWLGKIDQALACQVLRPSCEGSAYVQKYFAVLCPDAPAAKPLAGVTENLAVLCKLDNLQTFHSCEEAMVQQVLSKSFLNYADRPRFYQLKSQPSAPL